MLPPSTEYRVANRQYLDRTVDYTRQVDKSLPDLACLDYIIYPHEINKTDYSELCRRKANHAASRLLYEHKLKNPTVVLTCSNLPPLKDFNCVYDTQSNVKHLLRCVSITKRQWLLDNHYFKLTEGQSSKDILGRLTFDTCQALLYQTVNRDYFIVESLRRLPQCLFNELKNLNAKTILNDPLSYTPLWWTIYFGGRLTDALSEGDRALYEKLVNGSDTIFEHLPQPREYECLKNSSWKNYPMRAS